jgi:hypothetical protein
MNDHLFSSLQQQLKYELFFVKNVSKPYDDPQNKLKIIDFDYKGLPCHLVLNGSIKLQTRKKNVEIASFGDLIQELRYSTKS